MERFNGRKSREELLKRPEIPKNPAPVGRRVISDRQRRMMAGVPLSETSDSEAEVNEREVKRAKVEEENADSVKETTNEVREEEETTLKENTDATKTLSVEYSDDSLFGKWDKRKARKEMNEKIRRTDELLGGEFNIFKDKAPPLELPKNRPSGSSSDGDAKTEVVDENNNNVKQRAADFHDVFVNKRKRGPVEKAEDSEDVEVLKRTPAGGNQRMDSPGSSKLTQSRRSTIHVYDSLSSDEMVSPDRLFSTPRKPNTSPLSILDISVIPRSSFAKNSVIPSFSAGPATPHTPRDPPHFAKATVASARKALFKDPPRAPRGSRKTVSNEEMSLIFSSDESVDRNVNTRRRGAFRRHSFSQAKTENNDRQPVDNGSTSDSEESDRDEAIQDKDSDSSIRSVLNTAIRENSEASDHEGDLEVSEREMKSSDSDSSRLKVNGGMQDEEEANEDNEGNGWDDGDDVVDYGNVDLSPVHLSPRQQQGDDDEEMENEDDFEDEVEEDNEDEDAMDDTDSIPDIRPPRRRRSLLALSNADDVEDDIEEDSVEEEENDDFVFPIRSARRRRAVVDPVDVDDVDDGVEEDNVEEEENDDVVLSIRATRRRRLPVARFDPDAVLQEGKDYVLRPRAISMFFTSLISKISLSSRSQPEPGLRRSTRNRMPTTRPWFGEHPVYEVTPGGDRVLKGVTRAVVKEKALIRAGTVNHKK